MRKWFLGLASLLLVLGVLVGCGTDSEQSAKQSSQGADSTENQNAAEQKEDSVTIVLSQNNGEKQIAKKEVTIEKGTTLMSVMEKNFELETSHNGGFITAIEGVSQDKGKTAWMFKVNGENAKVGAKDLKLSPGDQITFDLHAY
ncbi:DUF4430 domain-containing protein [Virgibacillus siamensis]|uniref:DUF4430 domain-containing protein n=1 Tax=Virgibacillus siamensis TaxID=480071 RepID=UPI0009855645|nr:DUF4430 domain-containing protein [Virgibacillus siamensis]